MVPALRTCFGAAKYTLPVVRLEEAGIVDLAVRLKAGFRFRGFLECRSGFGIMNNHKLPIACN